MLPAYVRASRFTMCQSDLISRVCLIKLDPINPAPPVTRMFGDFCIILDVKIFFEKEVVYL